MTEIKPPWIEYPGYPPSDIFWRQSGQIWFCYIWLPYWESLSADQKEIYLKKWNAPQEWLLYSEYINPEFKKWLDEIDNEI